MNNSDNNLKGCFGLAFILAILAMFAAIVGLIWFIIYAACSIVSLI